MLVNDLNFSHPICDFLHEGGVVEELSENLEGKIDGDFCFYNWSFLTLDPADNNWLIVDLLPLFAALELLQYGDKFVRDCLQIGIAGTSLHQKYLLLD